MANVSETPQWAEGIYQIETSDPVLGGPDGISNRQAKQLASRTSYLKQQVEKGGSDLAAHVAATDPHPQYAPKVSPVLTGTPTAPTPVNSDNSKKLATTEFVAKAIAALAGSAPEALDTLKELADALGNDPNFATTVLTKLSEKLAKDQNGADIPDKAQFVKNLGLGEGSALPVGVPVPWPSATPPTGWLKCNGAAFTASQYPKLALTYPSGRLPDLRGEFIRGWDDGRGVDSGRGILSLQSHAMQRMTGGVNAVHAQTVGATFSSSGVLGMSRVDSSIPPPGGGANYGGFSVSFDNNVSGINTSTENRPRNIAFNYIVRAA